MLKQTCALSFPQQLALIAILCVVRVVTEHLVKNEREHTAKDSAVEENG